VATGVSLRVVEEAVRRVVVMAEELADFAAAVVRLLSDEGLQMAHAEAALGLARAQFSPTACYAELLAFVPSSPLHLSRDRGSGH
jgi:hypothetical protein